MSKDIIIVRSKRLHKAFKENASRTLSLLIEGTDGARREDGIKQCIRTHFSRHSLSKNYCTQPASVYVPYQQEQQPRKRATQSRATGTSPHYDADANRYMCPICMESIAHRELTSIKCGHLFCAECLRRCMTHSLKCPICQKKIKPRHLRRVYI